LKVERRIKMNTGTERDFSTGNGSTATQPLASALNEAAKPSPLVQTKSVNANTLQTLAELLSLIQEDCRRYKEVLAPYSSELLPVFMKFEDDGGVIFIAAPPKHKLGTDKGHITLDGKPVTGWGDTDTNADTGKDTGNKEDTK
jgi:hypothetical protein